MNYPKSINKSSKYKGVTWNKARAIWRAFIQHNHNSIYLGEFENELDAARAYNNAAIKCHGEYAYLNAL